MLKTTSKINTIIEIVIEPAFTKFVMVWMPNGSENCFTRLL